MADEEGTEELQNIADAASKIASTATATTAAVQKGSGPQNLGFILDVNLQVTVEVGRTKMTIQDLLQLGQGSVIELEKLAGEALDIYINGKLVARGEAVIVNEKFGVRLTDILSPEERMESFN